MDTEQRTVTEEAAGDVLGIPVGDVRRLRKRELRENEGFVRDGRIKITESGLKKITGAIADEVPVADPVMPVMRSIRVDGTCPNPRILMGHFVDDGETVKVRVRVRDARNFVRGMTIESCRMVQSTLYSYEGRLPRLKGRWM